MGAVENVVGLLKDDRAALDLYAQPDPQGVERLDVFVIGVFGDEIRPFGPRSLVVAVVLRFYSWNLRGRQQGNGNQG